MSIFWGCIKFSILILFHSPMIQPWFLPNTLPEIETTPAIIFSNSLIQLFLNFNCEWLSGDIHELSSSIDPPFRLHQHWFPTYPIFQKWCCCIIIAFCLLAIKNVDFFILAWSFNFGTLIVDIHATTAYLAHCHGDLVKSIFLPIVLVIRFAWLCVLFFFKNHCLFINWLKEGTIHIN